MKKVILYQIDDNDYSMKPMCEFGLVDGQVKIVKGRNTEGIWQDVERGIVGEDEKLLYPKDGIKFLARLKYAYSGSYVRAGDIFDD